MDGVGQTPVAMHDFDLEQDQTREEAADYLQNLADGLRQGSKMTFVVGDESATINPPMNLRLRMETSEDSSWLGGDEGRSFVVELGWELDEVDADGELAIINQPDVRETDRLARPASP